MPLPPAPTKRAARVAKEAFDVTARPGKRAASSQSAVIALDDELPISAVAAASEPAAVTSSPSASRSRKKVATTTASAATNAAAKRLAEQRAATQAAAQHTAAPASPTVAAQAAPVATPATGRKSKSTAALLAPSPAPAAPTPRVVKPASAKRTGQSCLFVLDTNVLLHDPTSLFRFEEHDIFLPMVVLEELDGHKKGMTEVARNGRQVSRTLDALVDIQKDADLAAGLRLDATGHKGATGHLFFQTVPLDNKLPSSLPQGKADNQILGVVQGLRLLKQGQQEVVLVSKDINMRVKARALGLPAEDYRNDKTLDDGDLLYTGSLALPADFWKKAKQVESWQDRGKTFYSFTSPLSAQMLINQYVYFEAPGEPSLHARVVEIRDKTVVIETLRDYSSTKHNVWGVNARNREQNFALNLLMDPDVDFVSLTGTAGTGKTLMALAAGLSQVLDDRRYTEIIMTRATVSVGEDIGFLPGTEEEKMGPWMGALDDNLEFLAKGDGGNPGEWGRAATNELIRSRIKIKSMNFMRGRTFLN
ncbi:MAG: PhoH family protein, partial [Comamonas sp.]